MKKKITQILAAALALTCGTSTATAIEKTVTLTATEHLSDLITEAEAPEVTSLKVITTDGSGTRFADLLTLDDMTFINTKLTGVKTVDLREAGILGTVDDRDRNNNPSMPAFGANQTIEVMYLPNNVKNIAGGCFSKSVLREVYLPASVNGAGNVKFRFSDNYDLEKVEFYQEHPQMKSVDGAVYSADGTQLIFYPSGIKTADVVVPEGVTNFIDAATIGANKYIETITLPTTLNTLTKGGREFGAKTGQSETNLNLRAIYVAEGNPIYESIDGMLIDKNLKQVAVCPPAFAIADLRIDGSRIVKLDNSVFSGNQTIKRVTITEGLTELGFGVFKGSAAIEYVDLPASLELIGAEVFHGCSALRTIISRKATAPALTARDAQTMGYVNFRAIPEDCLIGVPAGSLDAYRNSFWNRTYTDAQYTKNESQGFLPDQFAEYASVDVDGGKADSDVAVPGRMVAVEADRPADDKTAFVRWTSEPAVDFVNALSKKTSFTMPGSAVKVTAVFAATRKYTIVDAITLSGEAAVGSTVNIEAPSSKDGMPFDKWIVNKGDVEFADTHAVQTSFVMPDEDVEIQATFARMYMVTVIDGSATVDGEPAVDVMPGTTVTVTADKRDGFMFTSWTTELADLVFADSKASTTTFVMPASDVIVTAGYEKIPTGAGMIESGAQVPYIVYDLAGVAIESGADKPESFGHLPAGIYIVKTQEGAERIAVK